MEEKREQGVVQAMTDELDSPIRYSLSARYVVRGRPLPFQDAQQKMISRSLPHLARVR